MRVLIASTNPGKLREFRAILQNFPHELVQPAQIGLRLGVEETGGNYRENAALKARAYATASGLAALADDSGLEVEALDGAPGLFSARYSPLPGAGDGDRRKHLLAELARRGHPQPWNARFVCAAAFALPDGQLWEAEGSCAGEIIAEERGTGGFGYDPLFYLPDFGKTMAELEEGVKNRISHRAVALQRLTDLLSGWE